MTRTRKRTRNGISVLAAALLFLIPVRGEKKPKQQPYAVIAGTVFREPGFALPGADVTLVADPPLSKFKPMKAVSDARGEFSFRVTPAEARYIVRVRANGFGAQEKEAKISGEQRVDVFFQLKPEVR
jgi:hypothetical protein